MKNRYYRLALLLCLILAGALVTGCGAGAAGSGKSGDTDTAAVVEETTETEAADTGEADTEEAVTEEAAAEESEAQDVVYMGGLYISDPENDLMMALFREDGDPTVVVTELGNTWYGEFETEEAVLEDGRTIEKLTINGEKETVFGYFFDEGYGEDPTVGGILADENGKVYDAKPLDESVAMEMLEAAKKTP